MTQFLYLDSKTLINVAAIEKIGMGSKGDSAWVVLRDGERREIGGDDIDKIRRSLLPVIPAQSGYFVVRYGDDGDGKPWVGRTQIVAWRVDDDRAIPVTPLDDDDGFGGGILDPNGRVIVPYDRTFETEAEWRAEMASRRDEERRKAKERRLTVVESDK